MDTTDKLITRIEQLVLEKSRLSERLESYRASESDFLFREKQDLDAIKQLQKELSSVRLALVKASEWEECHKLLKKENDETFERYQEEYAKVNSLLAENFALITELDNLRKDIASMKAEGETLVKERDSLKEELASALGMVTIPRKG
jgi:chromosome segregation ATPase